MSLDQAQAQLSQVAATIAAANSTTNTGRGIGVRPLRDHLVGSSTRLWMLMLLTDDDRAGAEAVVILSDAAARMPFAGDDPLGRVVIVAGGERRVVGIVADARQSSLEVSPHPEVYVPMAQSPYRYGYLILRTSGDPNDALPGLRAIVAQVLPQEPLRLIARFDDLVAVQTAERRLNGLMFGLFGLLGLVISAVGIFGVIAYLVSQQARDIGVRMALGATRSRVVAGVLGHAGQLVAAGLIAGGLAAWWLSGLAGRFLFGLDPRDPRAYAVAMIALLLPHSSQPCYLPAVPRASIQSRCCETSRRIPLRREERERRRC